MNGNSVRRAVAAAAAHDAVVTVGQAVVNPTTKTTRVEIVFDTNPWSDWVAAGQSPTGVRPTEAVLFDFPSNYPETPPVPSLRPDFNRSLPHFQPFLHCGRPVPCLYDGSLVELLHRDGFGGFCNQMAEWLRRAADKSLLDETHGWEPVRRDDLRVFLEADAESLRRIVDPQGGHQVHQLDYLRTASEPRTVVFGQIRGRVDSFDRTNMVDFLNESGGWGGCEYLGGKSLALVIWAGQTESGQLVECQRYVPESVSTAADLEDRAAHYECSTEFSDGVRRVQRVVGQFHWLRSFPLAIIFLVRRPFPLIGSDSSIEICPYMASFAVLKADKNMTESVTPAGHLQPLSCTLLSRMATGNKEATRRRWVLVGAGSIGSKIALHLARAGRGPAVVIDNQAMGAHNMARHALHPVVGDPSSWLGRKAETLARTLRCLDQPVESVFENATVLASSRERATALWGKDTWAIVNSTASIPVRNALAVRDHASRIIETSLFADGTVGVVTVGGRDGNPNTADMMVEFYRRMADDACLRQMFANHANGVSRQEIGQGCGSVTMVMSDGRLSLHAAGMAEYLLQKHQNGLPSEAGEILIGQLDKAGLGVTWRTHCVAPLSVIPTTVSGEPWTVRVHRHAVDKIEKEADRWRDVETGGVAIGCVSEVTRSISVVDVLPCPEDSERSATAFLLGTAGGQEEIQALRKRSNGFLDAVGTWHSHLSEGDASKLDRDTARRLANEAKRPVLSLIKSPGGLVAWISDVDGVQAEV